MQLVRSPARCELAFSSRLTNVSMTSLRACVVTNQCRPSQRSMTLAQSAVTSPHKLLTSWTNSRWVGSAVWAADVQNGTMRATDSSADGFGSAGRLLATEKLQITENEFPVSTENAASSRKVGKFSVTHFCDMSRPNDWLDRPYSVRHSKNK